MLRTDITIQIELLKIAFPYAWPKDYSKQDWSIVIDVWFAQFGHLPEGVFKKGVGLCISKNDRFTVSEVWDCIFTVCGVPNQAQVSKAIGDSLEAWSKHELSNNPLSSHPLAKSVLEMIGGAHDARTIPAKDYGYRLSEAFKEERKTLKETLIQPKGLQMLTQGYEDYLLLEA